MLCIASKNLVNIWLLCFKNLIHERALSIFYRPDRAKTPLHK